MANVEGFFLNKQTDSAKTMCPILLIQGNTKVITEKYVNVPAIVGITLSRIVQLPS